ncbi:crossover junction endodeoxyribonuclease RuvC [Buchananella hordeovulneris]|uniref:Crossover junction endodeoxyribonuclease RuvC n=1 Tax=Buchananella hordeovulneris TaxID=52770 RepID=A0A1Q5PYE2_9ACTO|nr:crossover junction endodeoxyribonuclease RuvC [Buchananella hordeovulneris]MDO5080987.1 crossover junction endodeoxyribonuclease RuvC [Buchananella hordeovulneris]OKL52455.1 crossover junction endodeoxyribonuclease RuvC [Buchananella hordeovulneris]RRD45351.1 crossover junction endodeoxyribonuclease RuvC [Buchananella hordeovulneris]
MRVLGVDPGLTRCGLGVVDVDARRRATLVEVGVVRSDPHLAAHFRLLAIERGIEEWIERLAPEVVAVERVFAQDNLRSITGTSQVAGIAMLAAARRGLPLALHTPSEVKAAVTGSGRAGKAQVQAMVTSILRLPGPPRPADAADALALAICHGWRGTGIEGTGSDGTVNITHSGAVRARTALTPAQERWAAAAAAARRTGAVDPRRRRPR